MNQIIDKMIDSLINVENNIIVHLYIIKHVNKPVMSWAAIMKNDDQNHQFKFKTTCNSGSSRRRSEL